MNTNCADIGCPNPTPAQAHCAVCHRTFGGVSGFDRHRRGGRCRRPEYLGMVETAGVWRKPLSDAARQALRAVPAEPGAASSR